MLLPGPLRPDTISLVDSRDVSERGQWRRMVRWRHMLTGWTGGTMAKVVTGWLALLLGLTISCLTACSGSSSGSHTGPLDVAAAQRGMYNVVQPITGSADQKF